MQFYITPSRMHIQSQLNYVPIIQLLHHTSDNILNDSINNLRRLCEIGKIAQNEDTKVCITLHFIHKEFTEPIKEKISYKLLSSVTKQ